jgi:hypothetical protein
MSRVTPLFPLSRTGLSAFRRRRIIGGMRRPVGPVIPQTA